MLSCVQAAAEKETQKPWFWEQVIEHRCVPKIATPEARKFFTVKHFREGIVVYLKSPRRRRETNHLRKRFREGIVVYLKSPRRRREKFYL